MKFGIMKSHRRNQLLLIVILIVGAGSTLALVMQALNENINLFYSPAQVVAGEAPINQRIRAGGMVVEGSIQRAVDSLQVRFLVGDLKSAQFPVVFDGILPDLFREGQGVIAGGSLDEGGVLVADEILAKHDENYMPPEVAQIMASQQGENPP
jgi:cytochrome c-type biogenesis protein CcmE